MVQVNIETPDTRRNHARRLKVMGYTYTQIGEMLGVSSQAVYSYLRIPRTPDMPNTCQHCGSPDELHVHHLSYEDDNHYEVLCAGCHTRAHSKDEPVEPLPFWKPIIYEPTKPAFTREGVERIDGRGRPLKNPNDRREPFPMRFSAVELDQFKKAAGDTPLREWITQTLLEQARLAEQN